MVMLRLWCGYGDKFGKAATALCLGVVLAFGALVLPGVSLRPAQAQTQDTTPGLTTAPQCDAVDQLACSCTKAGVKPLNALVSPCFAGDLNRAEPEQTDPFGNMVFSALNWPKDQPRGVARFDTTPAKAAVDGDYVTVWESWPNARDLFPGKGLVPQAWDTAQPILPPACQALDLQAEKAEHAAALVPDDSPIRVLDDYVNPDGDVLVDAAGLPVRYEILYNRQAYDYVLGNRFFDREAVNAYLAANGVIAFPEGKWGKFNRGAIIIKAAWKLFDPVRDRPQRFHKSWAYIWPVVRDGAIHKDECDVQPVALIAMHVSLKLGIAPDWLWTTFEHQAVAPGWHQLYNVDNGKKRLRPYADPDPDTNRDNWLFNPSRDIECGNCVAVSPLNAGAPIVNGVVPTLPTRLITEHPRGYNFSAPDPDPNAIVTPAPGKRRVNSVSLTSYPIMDGFMLQGFGGTALQHYRLKGTQWVKPITRYHVPEILANSVLEAFSQSTSSCLSCHAEAGKTKTRTGDHPFDYVFSLGQCGMDTTEETDETCLR